jgi:hypothetical protein
MKGNIQMLVKIPLNKKDLEVISNLDTVLSILTVKTRKKYFKDVIDPLEAIPEDIFRVAESSYLKHLQKLFLDSIPLKDIQEESKSSYVLEADDFEDVGRIFRSDSRTPNEILIRHQRSAHYNKFRPTSQTIKITIKKQLKSYILIEISQEKS